MTHQNLFLATTALDAFWDKDKTLLFLGSWCLPFSKQENYKQLTYQILPDQWEDKTTRIQAQVYIEALHGMFMNELTTRLNMILKVNHSGRFWEILLGSWLRVYLSALYDRFVMLEKVYAFFPDITTIGLSEENYKIPTTGGDFVNWLAQDEYNLQIYTQILTYLGIRFARKSMHENPSLNKISSTKEKYKFKIRQLAQQLFLKLGHKQGIILAESGFSLIHLCKFFFYSKGKVLPLNFYEPLDVQFDVNKRAALTDFMQGRSNFENCAIALLPFFLPMAYLEAYADVMAWVKRFNFEPKAIFSAMGWHYSERFKYLAAYHSEKNSLLCGHQHGGDYGILAYHIAEQHETKVIDQFYTWGWQNPRDTKKYIPLTGLKLQNKKRNTSVTTLLYGCANQYRYLRRFNFSIAHQLHYYAMQREFIEHLSFQLLPELLIRLYHTDWGWEREARWQAINPNLKFQDVRIPFPKALQTARLYIVDHISTTFAESMAFNKPTILFCDREMWEIRADAEPYFAALKAQEIYFDNAKDAAGQLNEIGDRIESWWHAPARQAAVKEFSAQFCKPASQHLREWRQMFHDLLKSPLL